MVPFVDGHTGHLAYHPVMGKGLGQEASTSRLGTTGRAPLWASASDERICATPTALTHMATATAPNTRTRWRLDRGITPAFRSSTPSLHCGRGPCCARGGPMAGSAGTSTESSQLPAECNRALFIAADTVHVKGDPPRLSQQGLGSRARSSPLERRRGWRTSRLPASIAPAARPSVPRATTPDPVNPFRGNPAKNLASFLRCRRSRNSLVGGA